MKEKPTLLIIGNSNVGKSSLTKVLLPEPSKYKGKIGKKPGSTLLIKEINAPNLPYKILDLPGFGFIQHQSHRREHHIKNQIVNHIEKYYLEFFLAIVVLNILRIEDEIIKYHIQNKTTIPLSFELIKFLEELEIPILILINKIDKISNRNREKNILLFVKIAQEYGIELINVDDSNFISNKNQLPFLAFSALKKINLSKLKHFIDLCLSRSS